MEKFTRSVGIRAGKLVKKAMMIRFAINLLLNKLNVVRALRNIKPVIQLGIGLGAFNVIYHSTRWLFAERRKSAANNNRTNNFW